MRAEWGGSGVWHMMCIWGSPSAHQWPVLAVYTLRPSSTASLLQAPGHPGLACAWPVSLSVVTNTTSSLAVLCHNNIIPILWHGDSKQSDKHSIFSHESEKAFAKTFHVRYSKNDTRCRLFKINNKSADYKNNKNSQMSCYHLYRVNSVQQNENNITCLQAPHSFYIKINWYSFTYVCLYIPCKSLCRRCPLCTWTFHYEDNVCRPLAF